MKAKGWVTMQRWCMVDDWKRDFLAFSLFFLLLWAGIFVMGNIKHLWMDEMTNMLCCVTKFVAQQNLHCCHQPRQTNTELSNLAEKKHANKLSFSFWNGHFFVWLFKFKPCWLSMWCNNSIVKKKRILKPVGLKFLLPPQTRAPGVRVLDISGPWRASTFGNWMCHRVWPSLHLSQWWSSFACHHCCRWMVAAR